jgi:hypothetical protein
MTNDQEKRRDNFMRLARMANAVPVDHFYVTDVFLEKFAEMVAAEEREACAKICESLITEGDPYPANFVLKTCAKTIRARNE